MDNANYPDSIKKLIVLFMNGYYITKCKKLDDEKNQ